MDENTRYLKVWKLLHKVAHRYFEIRFNFSHENYTLDAPSLIVSNHVTNWDPLLLAICFPENNLHFVASEHLFRMGWISKIIDWLVAPIPRRKGSNGTDTAMASIRKIRSGSSVALFAEGETTWSGCNRSIFPATGVLAKACRSNLVTYRFEGAFLTAPRWGKGVRRGKMRGHIVNVYTPEQLKALSPEEITDIINRDVYEDAWARQKETLTPFRSPRMAEGAEIPLFLCPKCKRIGGLSTKGNRIRCTCGMETQMNVYGFFEPAQPFETMKQWDDWQLESLKAMDFVHDDALFSDDGMTLKEITADHGEQKLDSGALTLHKDALICGNTRFPLNEIKEMSPVQSRILVFTHNQRYYEIRAKKPRCMRKYHHFWENLTSGTK